MKRFFSIITIIAILVSFASCSLNEINIKAMTELTGSEYCKIIDHMESHTISENDKKMEEVLNKFCDEELDMKIKFSIFYPIDNDDSIFIFETTDTRYYVVPVDEKVITNINWCSDWTKLELKEISENESKIALKFSNWEAREISEKDATFLRQYSVLEDTENMPYLFATDDPQEKEEYELYFSYREKILKNPNIDPENFYDHLILYMDEYHYIYRSERNWFTI